MTFTRRFALERRPRETSRTPTDELRSVLAHNEGRSRFKCLRVNFPVLGGPARPGGLACVHGYCVRAHKYPCDFV